MKPYLNLFAAIVLATALPIAAGAATPPIPDPAYGGGTGIARITAERLSANSGYAMHAIAQTDGRLVLVGTASRPGTQQTDYEVVLARLDAQGLPDAAFGPNHDGIYHTAFSGSANDVAQTRDGKLIYSGYGYLSNAIIVGRLNADGTPDTSFLLSGRRLIAPSALVDGAIMGLFSTVLPLPDGKTLALGGTMVPPAPEQTFACAMRLLADGSTDASFGNAGRTCIAPPLQSGVGSMAWSGLVLADGRILLAGNSLHSGGSGWDMSVARLSANGTLDTSFGPAHDGWTFVGFDQGGTMLDMAMAITIDREGRILLAGYFQGAHGNDIGIARLLADGRLDPSFGSQGRVQLALDLGGFDDDRAHSIAVRSDGGILVGGSTYTSEGVGVAILLKSDGQFDPRFGNGGVFFQADPAGPGMAKVESNQQIVAGDHLYMVGSALNATGSRNDFAATRTVLPLFADGFDR